MRKLVLLISICSTPVFAQGYEDNYDYGSAIQYEPFVTGEFVDGVSGGMVSAVNDAARKVGEAIRAGIERQGMHNSQVRRQRMDRAQGHPTNHNRVYNRGGRNV